MKKLLSLILAAMMLLSVGSTLAEAELSAYSQAIDTSVDYPVFWEADCALPLVEEPITVKVLFKRNASHPDDFSDVWWVKYCAEMTGITFEFELVEEAAWKERMNLAFISDDYPEVIFYDISKDEILQYGAEGKLIDLGPLMKEHAPNLMTLYETWPDVVKGTIQENGAIYNVPMISYAPRSANPVPTLFNEDWLTAVGKEIPTSLDELYDVLKAFKEGDPNGNGEADEIPLYPVGTGNNFILYAFGYTDMQHEIIDGKYLFVPAQDNYRAYLEYMKKLYTEGLLAKDYFTQTNESRQADIVSGKVGAITEAVTAILEDYENYIPAPAMASAYCTELVWPETSIHFQSNVSNFVVTDKCQNPEAIVKFLNWLVTTEASLSVRLGPSNQQDPDGYGYSYDYIENKHAYGATRSFPDDYASYYNFRMSQTVMFAPAYINPLVDDIVVGSDDKNNWQTTQWTQSGVSAHGKPIASLLLTFSDEESTDLAYYIDLTDYATSMRAKFITGETELTDATWAEYLSTLESYGLSDMCELYQGAHDRYLALPETF